VKGKTPAKKPAVNNNVEKMADNHISFCCHDASEGYVVIGYLKSYGNTWGQAKISVIATLTNGKQYPYPIQIEESMWTEKYSIPTLLTILPNKNIIGKISQINITISVLKREKFKILTLGCC
jgi:hypothetical protein